MIDLEFWVSFWEKRCFGLREAPMRQKGMIWKTVIVWLLKLKSAHFAGNLLARWALKHRTSFARSYCYNMCPLNPIVWCYVWHYVWYYVVINKVVLLLSKIMVTWIFWHYHIVHEMHSMWFMWFSHKRYKSQVLC